MNELVSVIVPVYNVEKYLKKCVNSIINQTYKSLEIILVDDGSPDRSGALCDRLAEKDSRIRVIHKANGGVSTARNAGECGLGYGFSGRERESRFCDGFSNSGRSYACA